MTSIKIGFVLSSNSSHQLPSTRIAVLNMLPFLRTAGLDARIVFEPEAPTERPDLSGLGERLRAEGFRIVFFQKVRGPSAEQLARELGAAGIKTVFGVCDVVDTAMATATDATACVTEYLKSLYPPSVQSKIRVVLDGIENPGARKTDWSNNPGSRSCPLRAILVTSSSLSHLPVIGKPPEWLEVSIAGNYPRPSQHLRRLKEVRWRMLRLQRGERLAYLRFLADPRIRRIPWEPVGIYERMRAADIGIIPIDVTPDLGTSVPAPSWKVKSENRLTMKMAVGLPVVATPIPAYEAVIEHGVNGFLASSAHDWRRHLEALRDPQLRREIGEKARNSVIARFSIEAQARHLVDLLADLARGDPVSQKAG